MTSPEPSFTDRWLAERFADTSELDWLARTPRPFYRRAFLQQNAFGGRLAYDVELDPGPLDGARAPWAPQYAEAPDNDYYEQCFEAWGEPFRLEYLAEWQRENLPGADQSG